LLNTIFEHGTPLHDGAVIIHRGRILAAGCTLQISDAPNIGANVHMRHRAAIGASEQSDAIVVVVSEETGTISIAESGRLVRGLSQDALRVRLMERLGIQRTPSRKPWTRNGKGAAR
jgi:diadenylate cyclase